MTAAGTPTSRYVRLHQASAAARTTIRGVARGVPRDGLLADEIRVLRRRSAARFTFAAAASAARASRPHTAVEPSQQLPAVAHEKPSRGLYARRDDRAREEGGRDLAASPRAKDQVDRTQDSLSPRVFDPVIAPTAVLARPDLSGQPLASHRWPGRALELRFAGNAGPIRTANYRVRCRNSHDRAAWLAALGASRIHVRVTRGACAESTRTVLAFARRESRPETDLVPSRGVRDRRIRGVDPRGKSS